MTTYWNAEKYSQIGTPMTHWATDLISDLQFRGDETVMDAGCGSGVVTLQIAEKLPKGTIYAVDSSTEMIASLKNRLSIHQPPLTCRIEPIIAELVSVILPSPVDLVFSNAVFHWIQDDDGLFSNLYRQAKAGGKLRAQCGGFGNIARLYEAVDVVQQKPEYSALRHFRDSKKYRSAPQAVKALQKAGWTDVRANTFEAPIPFPDHAKAAEYVGTIALRDHLVQLPLELHQKYLNDVVSTSIAQHGEPFVLDYVRLNLWGTKAASIS
jgi:trans-aconitate 2-methyltransferase